MECCYQYDQRWPNADFQHVPAYFAIDEGPFSIQLTDTFRSVDPIALLSISNQHRLPIQTFHTDDQYYAYKAERQSIHHGDIL